MTPRIPSDLTGLRGLTVEALKTLAAGHSAGTVRANGRIQGGAPHRARDAQSSALRVVKRLYSLREAAIYLGVGFPF